MYSILIYIIIAFLFYIFSKDVRKVLIEGQTLESYDYQEFQHIIDDDMINEKVKEHLNKYSDDIDKILKNTIKDKNVDSKLVERLCTLTGQALAKLAQGQDQQASL